MSMPPPPPHQQPPGPGPYGPPQPYPQQQPYPPQSYPQQPGASYGPGSYGAPPPPAPPKKRTGLVVGIVAGSLAVLGLLAWVGTQAYDAVSEAGGSYPAAEYKLTAPVTVLSGTYKLTSDTSEKDGKDVEAEDAKDPSVRVTKSVVATYTGEPGSALVVSGFYGQLRAPDLTRRQILEGGATGQGTTLVVRPKDFKPAGADITISCQVTRSTDMGTTSTLPMCAWGDGNTASFVALVTPEIAAQQPEDVDLRALAETTAKVRAELRKPLR
ncbi:hypothetical protein ACIRNI_00850 [Streptomyces sp. NPDC093546]|uniref:hypothetical protein n=1 Tax=Streptomyces sp. NPDC093546 TaxID=3366040 RepID=UPI0038080F61